MTEHEKMLAGELYDANFDPAILKERMNAEVLTWEFNSLRPDDPRKNELLRQIMGELREGVTVLSPVYFDYGSLTKLGSGTFVNHGCYFMDGGSITIGKNCFIGVIFGGNRIKKIKWYRTVIVNFFCVIHLSNQCYIFG